MPNTVLSAENTMVSKNKLGPYSCEACGWQAKSIKEISQKLQNRKKRREGHSAISMYNKASDTLAREDFPEAVTVVLMNES